jgi:hypothetical protein
MLDFRGVEDLLAAYVPYMHNTYFAVFAISSLIYLAAKLFMPRRRRLVTRPAAPPAPEPHMREASAPARVPLLRGAVTFIMYASRCPTALL